MKYLVTGIAGSGKTSVMDELSRRGYTSYSIDDIEDAVRLEDQTTGKPVDWPDGPTDFSRYAWNWQPEGLKKLLESSPDVFIGGTSSNQYDFADWFDKIFVLTVSEPTQHHRLTTRTNNDFGKHPEDLERTLRIRETVEQEALDHGAIPIDAEQSITKVTDDIVRRIDHDNR